MHIERVKNFLINARNVSNVRSQFICARISETNFSSSLCMCMNLHRGHLDSNRGTQSVRAITSPGANYISARPPLVADALTLAMRCAYRNEYITASQSNRRTLAGQLIKLTSLN